MSAGRGGSRSGTAVPETTSARPPEYVAPDRATGWWFTGLAVLALLAVALHLAAGYGFPRPWPDESHFLAPALALARTGSLAVPELNAPRGIFWMPDGYSVLLAPLLATGVPALEAARWVSLCGVVVFAGAVGSVARRAGVLGPAALAAVAAWLCAPRVVMAANIARMEAVVLGAAGAVLWLVDRERWLAAAAVAVASVAIHPVAAALPLAVAVAAVARRDRLRRPARGEWLLAAVVAVALLAQVWRFLEAGTLAGEHLSFQLSRKAGRPLALTPQQVIGGMAAAAAAVAIPFAGRARARPTVVCAAALAVGLVGIDVAGREQWYELLGRETAVLLAAVVVAAVVSARGGPRRAGLALAGAAVLLGAGGLWATTTQPRLGMRLADGDRGEWEAFRRDAAAAVAALDPVADRPTIVELDPLSGLGQELFAVRRPLLLVVQPTPVTPLDEPGGDYLVVTPGAPFVTPGLVESRPGDADPIEVRSPHGTFALRIHPRDG